MQTHIGFTGTQLGMTAAQADEVRRILTSLKGTHFHHGDCVGADSEAHDIATSLGYEIVLHPPTNNSRRAFKSADIVLPAKPYLERNHDIVDSVKVMLATPKTDSEELRSGTWATIRYARRRGKNIKIIVPTGVQEEFCQPEER